MKKLRCQPADKNQKGYVAITVLILMLVLVAIVYLYADALFSELSIARNNKGAQVAFSIAEACTQNALYKVQYDLSDVRPKFLVYDSNSPLTADYTINSSLLINRGSCRVIIQNTAPGVAVITSTGQYQIYTFKTAQRQIKTTIAEATAGQPYDLGMFTHPIKGDTQATGDIELDGATIQILGSNHLLNAGLTSGRSISIKNNSTVNVEGSIHIGPTAAPPNDSNYNKDPSSVVNCDCYINNDPNPDVNPPSLCNTSPGCSVGSAAAGEMPKVDFNSYKQIAENYVPSQYFDKPQDFLDFAASHPILNGVFYVDGDLKIQDGQTININGLLLAKSITVGENSGSTTTTLNITNPDNNINPHGVAVEKNFIVETKGSFSAVGLIWSGIATEFKDSLRSPINLTGGILSRRIKITDRTVNIQFDAAIINVVIGSYAPVIELNHWEEEY